jgi:hypothetical protein
MEDAPVTTAYVESGFGGYDYFKHHTISSEHAVFGLVSIERLHAFQSDEEKLEKKNKGQRIEDWEALGKTWSLTSYKAYPRAVRLELMRVLQKNVAFQSMCVLKPREKKRIQRTATRDRLQLCRAAYINKQLLALMDFRFYDSLKVTLQSKPLTPFSFCHLLTLRSIH